MQSAGKPLPDPTPPIKITLTSIFTEKSIRKLQALSQELNDFLNTQFPGVQSSDHSRRMIEDIIKVLGLLCEHNEIGYWKKEDNVLALTKLVDFIDNETGTQVPEVFNEQTYQLGKKIIEAFKQIKFSEDVNTLVLIALETISGKPERLIATMQKNLERKLKLYEMFQRSKRETEKMQAVKLSIATRMQTLEESAKNLTSDTYAAFQRTYEETCRALLSEIEALEDYTSLCHPDLFINTPTPHKLSPEQIKTQGNRSDCIQSLIAGETRVNAILLSSHFAKILLVHDHYAASFSSDQFAKLSQDFKDLKKEFFDMLDLYLTGDHLYRSGNFFVGLAKKINGINSDKKKCVENLKIEVDAIFASTRPDYSICAKSFEIFKAIYTAIGVNEAIAKKKEISLGETSKIFNLFTLKFLSFALEVNQSNDSSLDLFLQKCERQMGIERPPVVTAPAPPVPKM